MSEPLVRPLVPGEECEVARITVAAYAAEGYLLPDDPYADELADVPARVRGAEVWVAELDGRVVGTVTWCPPGSAFREVATRDDQAEFRMLAVEPTARRRGVAAALVDACLARAYSDGAREVVLCSLPQMAAAHGLYARAGFLRAPQLDWAPRESICLWAFSRSVSPAGP